MWKSEESPAFTGLGLLRPSGSFSKCLYILDYLTPFISLFPPPSPTHTHTHSGVTTQALSTIAVSLDHSLTYFGGVAGSLPEPRALIGWTDQLVPTLSGSASTSPTGPSPDPEAPLSMLSSVLISSDWTPRVS